MTNDPTTAVEVAPAVATLSDSQATELFEVSQPFVGRWNKLVSTTNWEKGRIIAQWRDALRDRGSPINEYADETWAQLVGGVTGQHVGRLRRVYQRFGQSAEKFHGLFWSHFQAALDWNDADMWLEGAVQSGWSVSRMRQQRWETLGRVESERPREADVVVDEPQGDATNTRSGDEPLQALRGTFQEEPGPRREEPDFGDDAPALIPQTADGPTFADDVPFDTLPAEPLVQPFAALPDLPDDLAEAFEEMKLALLRHKTEGWREIRCDEALRMLDALKQLALAPSEQN